MSHKEFSLSIDNLDVGNAVMQKNSTERSISVIQKYLLTMPRAFCGKKGLKNA